jgi:tetratricopeptide (TPR) repeat protein
MSVATKTLGLLAGLATNLSASEFYALNPTDGATYLGLAGACILSEAWAEKHGKADAQEACAQAVKELWERQGTLLKAIESLSTESHLHEFVSRDRAAQFVRLLRRGTREIEVALTENTELLAYAARWIETWCEQHHENQLQFEKHVDDFSKELTKRLEVLDAKVTQGFGNVAAGQNAILTSVEGIRQALTQQSELHEQVEQLRKERDLAVKRAEEAEKRGVDAAKRALDELRASGNSQKLLLLLIRERDLTRKDFTQRSREIAATAYFQHDYQTALDAILEVERRDPTDLIALNVKGCIYYRMGEFKLAQTTLEQLIGRSRKAKVLALEAAGLGNLANVELDSTTLTRLGGFTKRPSVLMKRWGLRVPLR